MEDSKKLHSIIDSMFAASTFACGLAVGIHRCQTDLGYSEYDLRPIIGDSAGVTIREAYYALREHLLKELTRLEESQIPLPLESPTSPDSPHHSQ